MTIRARVIRKPPLNHNDRVVICHGRHRDSEARVVQKEPGYRALLQLDDGTHIIMSRHYIIKLIQPWYAPNGKATQTQ